MVDTDSIHIEAEDEEKRAIFSPTSQNVLIIPKNKFSPNPLSKDGK